MIKTLFAVGVAAASLGVIALPVQAAGLSPAACDDIEYSVADNADAIAAQLEQQGYAVSGVDEWSNCVRAFVVNADGSTGMAFFDPLTLRPVGGDYLGI
jgi:hypothetical protein